MATPSDHPAAAYPTWLPHPRVPVTVIVGPPGNGALEHAQSHRQAGEVIIDLPSIITELSAGQGDPAAWTIRALEQRNGRLAALADAEHLDQTGTAGAWLVAASPKQWQRDFWSRALGARIVLLNPGREAALAAATAAGVPAKFVHQWFAEAADTDPAMPAARRTPAPRDERPAERRESASQRGYDRNHRVLRDEQLAREPWCRFCWEEHGRRVPATVLDHITPFKRPDGSFDGKLWGDKKNHRSLCGPCHQARGAQRNRPEKPPGAAADGRPMDPAHPWNRNR